MKFRNRISSYQTYFQIPHSLSNSLPVTFDHLALLGARGSALVWTPGGASADGWNTTKDGLGIESAADDGVGDIGRQGEEGIGKVGGSSVVGVESRDQLGVLTANVHHGVNGGSREDSHLSRLENLCDSAGAILCDHGSLTQR